MKKEERDLYNEKCELTGKTYFKGDPIPENHYPMVVMIAIQNSKGEFLMQKRVPRKGGDWGVTGGHPKAGETTDQGIISEVLEELGVDISNEKLEVFASGCDKVDCYKMYYLQKDFNVSDFNIQEDELTEVKWFSIDTLYKMVETKELNPNQVDFFVKCMNYLKHNKRFYVKHEFPTNSDFIKLFKSVGWDREEERINKNRSNTCFAVSIYEQDEIVGMGRIVGDGCYYTIYDIVTRGDKHGLGIGSIVMTELVNWYKIIKDDDTYLYLGASKGKEPFYEKFGFKSRPNENVGAGMKWYE